MFKYVHHIEIVVRSREDLVAYMDRNFGMKPSALREKDGGRGKEARYKVGPTLLRFIEPAPGTKGANYLAAHGPGIEHIAWAVDDVTEAGKQMKAMEINFRDESALRNEYGIAPSKQGFTGINLDPKDTLGVFFQLSQDVPVPSEMSEKAT